MDPIIIATLITAAVSIGSSIAGYLSQKSARAEADAIAARSRNELGQIDPEKFKKAALEVLGPTKLAQIEANPKYAEAGDAVLGELKNISDRGGLSLADEANLNRLRGETSRRAKTMREQALDSMRRRGTLDSGDEVIAAMAAQQEATQRESQNDMDVAGMAQQRALDAIMRRGQLADSYDRRDYDRKADVARAEDRVNELNWRRRAESEGDSYNRAMNLYDRRLQLNQADANRAQGVANDDSRLAQGISSGVSNAATGAAAHYRAGKGAPSTTDASERSRYGSDSSPPPDDSLYYDLPDEEKYRSARKPHGWGS